MTLLLACLAVLDVPALAPAHQPSFGVASARRAIAYRRPEQLVETPRLANYDAGHVSPGMSFPYNVLPHWAPQPNTAAIVADAVLVAVACCIFLPAFLAMRSICAISRPLDMMANAFTRRYIGQAQRARQVHRLRRAAPTGGLKQR